jgi:hypothetical protein
MPACARLSYIEVSRPPRSLRPFGKSETSSLFLFALEFSIVQTLGRKRKTSSVSQIASLEAAYGALVWRSSAARAASTRCQLVSTRRNCSGVQ